MFITIIKNDNPNSFTLMDTEHNCFAINISSNHDLIKVYQWANNKFKCLKEQKVDLRYILSVYGGNNMKQTNAIKTDYELLEYQNMNLWYKNIETLKEISSFSSMPLANAFLLGVIAGKREERKKKHK